MKADRSRWAEQSLSWVLSAKSLGLISLLISPETKDSSQSGHLALELTSLQGIKYQEEIWLGKYTAFSQRLFLLYLLAVGKSGIYPWCEIWPPHSHLGSWGWNHGNFTSVGSGETKFGLKARASSTHIKRSLKGCGDLGDAALYYVSGTSGCFSL